MKLSDARKKSGLSQMELAKQLNVNQSLISHWESGRENPNEFYRQQMDQVLTRAVDWMAEFEPLDAVEGNALLRFAGYAYKENDVANAAALLFSPKLYDVRQRLKQHGFLPKNYQPKTELEEILLPMGMKDKETTKTITEEEVT